MQEAKKQNDIITKLLYKIAEKDKEKKPFNININFNNLKNIDIFNSLNDPIFFENNISIFKLIEKPLLKFYFLFSE